MTELARRPRVPRAVRAKARMYVFLGIFAIWGVLGLVQSFKGASSDVTPSLRHLEETKSEGEGEGEDLKPWEHKYGLVVYSLALLYLFISLAAVCDEYFVEVLEKITEKLGVSPDVAGATFMAAGSSAPELFVSLADNVISKPKESMGIGTIVGSAIFNILVIISLSALLAGQTLKLDWRPLVRDSLWYCYAILLLTYSIWDGKVTTWEGLGLFISYILYCSYMSINERVIAKCCKRPEEEEEEETNAAAAAPGQSLGVAMMVGLAAKKFKAKKKKEYVPEVNPMLLPKYRVFQSRASSSFRRSQFQEHDPAVPGVETIPEEEEEVLGPYFASIWEVPDGIVAKIWFVITRPIFIVLRLTVPDTRYPQFSGTAGLAASFVVCILWICGLSSFTVSWATKVGNLLEIPGTVMGLTIVAMGTSVPDALSSILVARSGKGDMAVSNAIGSNCFDIMCGLGLPFFLSNLIYKEPAVVVVDDLQLSIFMLFGVLVTVLILLALSGWRLHRVVGGIMFTMYVAYVVFSYLHGA